MTDSEAKGFMTDLRESLHDYEEMVGEKAYILKLCDAHNRRYEEVCKTLKVKLERRASVLEQWCLLCNH